jgi:NAD(P)-dependent dehydrogenase (short-subunit alcohol dehydrogenase family)
MSLTWFITGASSGIGRLLTERLLERGDRVAATVRRPNALDDLSSAYGDRLWIETLELSDTESVRTVTNQVFSNLGRIDVLVSNAGYGVLGAAEEVNDRQVHDIIQTNLIGSIALIRAALPHMRAQGGGRILQVSSEGGQIAYPGFSLYHATKWGIEGFVEAVAQEVAPFGIEFTLVQPGPTSTGFAAGLVRPDPKQVYEATPVGEVRRGIDSGAFVITGDATKVAERMIEMIEGGQAPLRLTLGTSAFKRIQSALTQRLDALKAQAFIAQSVESGSPAPSSSAAAALAAITATDEKLPHEITMPGFISPDDQHYDERARALIRIGREAIAVENNDALDAYFADDFVLHGPTGDVSFPELKSFFAAMRQTFTGFICERREIITKGDFAAALTTMSGTFDKRFEATPVGPIEPNGVVMTLELVNLFRFNKEGKLVEEWVQYDNFGFLQQLGVKLTR